MAQTTGGAIKIFCNRTGITTEYYYEQIALGNKWCIGCRSFIPKCKFNIDNSRWDRLASRCHGCIRVKEPKSRKGIPSGRKGVKFTGKALENIQAAAKISAKNRIGKSKKYSKTGYENLLKAVRKPRPHVRGEKNFNWKGGSVDKRRRDMQRHEYREWRRIVFERDNYTCQDCGDDTGGNLNAHHIKSYSDFPDLRYEVSNGVTLCEPCHEKQHYNPNSTRNIKKRNRRSLQISLFPS